MFSSQRASVSTGTVAKSGLAAIVRIRIKGCPELGLCSWTISPSPPAFAGTGSNPLPQDARRLMQITVIPAKAGIQTPVYRVPWLLLATMQTQGVLLSAARVFLEGCCLHGQTGVWIPAFAGMTVICIKRLKGEGIGEPPAYS